MNSDGEFYRGDPPPAGYGGPPASEAGRPPYPPPPGYGAGYGPPVHHGPPYYGPPPGGPVPFGYRRPTNTLAILAVVFIFVFAPVSLVLGLVARRQIRETGEEGDGLALAGVIVGGIAVGLFVLGLLFFVVAVASLAP